MAPTKTSAGRTTGRQKPRSAPTVRRTPPRSPTPSKTTATTAPRATRTTATEIRLSSPVLDVTRPPLRIDPDLTPLKIRPRFLDALKSRSPLSKLLDEPPALSGSGTAATDGRNVKVVFALVRDTLGRSKAGIPVHLRTQEEDTIIDRTHTNAAGVAVLRYPLKESLEGNIPPAAIHVLGTGLDPLDVVFTPSSQAAVVEAVMTDLPQVLDGAGDDPYTRIPSDFTPELCDQMARIIGDWEDPLMQNLDTPQDFRSRRTRITKRFTVPRIGPGTAEDGGPKRYLTYLRQEWTFLGYTLGELQEVESLDPGQVVGETVRTARRSSDRLAETVSNTLHETLTQVQDTLSRVGSVDTVVDVASRLHTSTDTGASLRGGIIGIPGLFGFGGVGADAHLSTTVTANATTRTSVDTSLMVNSMLRSAQSSVNRSVRTAANTLRSIAHTAMSATDQVAPLLSRATNLLRWTVYENYAVCTRVEDVVELRAVEVLDGEPDGAVFSAEDIVEHQALFQDRLLDPYVGHHYGALRRAVDVQRSAERPVTAIRFDVEYAAQICGADLRIQVGGEDIVLALRPKGRIARGTLHLPEPIDEEDLGMAQLSLNLRPDRCSLPDMPFNIDDLLRDMAQAQVTRVRMSFEKIPGTRLRDDMAIDGLVVDAGTPTRQQEIPLEVPAPHVFPEHNPLYLHINRNPNHYIGILLQAALDRPSMRDDCKQIRDVFPGDHAIWRLPIIGFEGDRVLVVGDAPKDDKFVQKLLADPGAGTIVQLAAPGAYSEALQGLLQLTDAAGQVHPDLLPDPAPTVPPLALVDLAGRTLQVAPEDGTVDSTPGGTLPGVPMP